jgi:hypothetical protein
MRKGEKADVRIAPDYAYGNSGVGPIPGGSTLLFEIELLGWRRWGAVPCPALPCPAYCTYCMYAFLIFYPDRLPFPPPSILSRSPQDVLKDSVEFSDLLTAVILILLAGGLVFYFIL